MVVSPWTIWQGFRQSYLCGRPSWTAENMPDMEGKVTIVTGGNSGIGKETARRLLEHNAKVYIACRNEAKALDAIQELREQTGKQATFLHLDLADLQSVKRAAEEFASKEKQLHVLFNNGGVMKASSQDRTATGHELHFGTNVLGHFYLTKLLLPILLETAKSSNEPARVIHLSSATIYTHTSTIDFATLKGDRPLFNAAFCYGQSKLANVIFSNELARRYGDQGIVSISLNPGNIRTNLKTNLNLFFNALVTFLQLYPVEWGAVTQLYAGCAPEAANLNGKFLTPWARLGEPTPEAKDEDLAKDLWEWMEEQVANVD